MNVRVHIDRLVLDGIDVPYGARGALRASLERELARHILANGLHPELASGIAIPSVAAPPIDAHANPPRLGAAIAESVANGIGGRR
jgi:hypothetical protein